MNKLQRTNISESEPFIASDGNSVQADVMFQGSGGCQTRKLPQGNSRSYGAVFIVINAAMGAGLLTFPYAFYLTGGWQWGLVVQLVSERTRL